MPQDSPRKRVHPGLVPSAPDTLTRSRPPKPDRQVRVAAVVPWIGSAGMFVSLARWIETMNPLAAQTGVRWSGVAIKSLRIADRALIDRIARHCTVWVPSEAVNRGWPEGPLQPCANWRTAVDNAIESADVVHPWGFRRRPQGNWACSQIVCLANGDEAWTTRILEPWRDAVGGWAISRPALDAAPAWMKPRLRVVHWPVAASTAPRDNGRDRGRRTLGLAPDDRVVLWLGRLHTAKKPERALGCLTHLGSRWKLLIGGIPQPRQWQPPPPYLHLMKEGRVVLTRFEPESLDKAFAAADVMLHTSDSDGGPRTVAEAWAARVPVVSTSVGLVADTETLGLAKVVDDPDDHAAWAEAVRNAMRDPQQVARAWTWMRHHMDPDRQARQLADAFAEWADAEKPPEADAHPRRWDPRRPWLARRQRQDAK